uniref:Uncharacterized protein n=1 Tax=uncultured nuHF2 cluster bacterium HF0500_39O04 TaxID=723590 RepID=E7C699_9BACT|nr:hypothetical protein [uncultured nuHF2 cluster bacterium HF0500_39O04]
MPGVVEIVDTETAIPDPTAEIKAEAHAARDRTRDAVRAEGEAVREAWIEDRVGKLVPDNADDDTRDAARATVRRAVENSTLSGNFTVQVIEGNEPRAVTVVEVLDDPSRYDGMLTLDPLEPDYDGGRVVGKLYTAGARPNLFSFAHGGRTFRLMRQPARIEIVKGRTYDIVQGTLETLRRAPEAFDFGGALVTVDRGRVHPLDDAGLIHFLGGVVQYWRWNSARRAEPSGTLEDPPPRVAKQILSLGAGRHLKTLSAVVTVPTLRPDGTVFDTPGYDEATGLLFEATEDVVPVPAAPDRAEVVEALETLLHPFREFPVVAPDDWGVLLAALLTAVVRPALLTAPGFGFDAPVQGSGKTLLANCVGVLASGQAPAVWPHTAGKDDEEVRKRLFAALRQGCRALVWDNVVGTFNSAAMSAALTSSNFTDRILGKSESISVPNKAILLMTGNNLTLAGDMARRVLTCRIDPGTDHPFAREFDLDPLVHTRKHRQEMAAAGLTIVRGWMTADAERAPGRMASFEKWDDIVRQAVAWVGREIRPGEFGDPMNAVFTAQSGDPEQETLDKDPAGVLLQFTLTKGEFLCQARGVVAVMTASRTSFGFLFMEVPFG